MAIHDRYISEHFNLFNASFQEFTGMRPFTEHLQGEKRFFIYVCPLCLERRMGAQKNQLTMVGAFTKDHYPPRSVGGNKTLLICETCNNTAGSEFDYILEDWLRYRAFYQRIPGAKATMKDTIISAIPGKKYKGLLTINENRETEIDVKPNPKWPIPPLDKWIEDSKTNLDYKINFTLEEPLPIIITKALLKTAYLHCFVAWGYEFALSEQAQMIREVLYGLREFPLPNGYLAVVDGDSGITEGPMFIHSPREWQTLAVNIPLKVSDPDYQCHVIVPIPAPTETGWDDITKLKEWVGDETGMLNIGLTYMPFYLATGNLNGYSQSWRDHYKS